MQRPPIPPVDTPGAAWLRFFPALAVEGDHDVQAMFSSAQVVQLPVGQPVFLAGGACRNYLLVLEGVVRVHMVGESGREVTLYRVSAGDSCVLTTSCLLGRDAYPASAVTETPVVAVVMPAHSFEVAMDRSRTFRAFVFANLGRRLAQVIHRMQDVSLGAIDRRLIRFILERTAPDGTVHATHEAVALDLGTAREVVSRHLKHLEAQGLVRLARGRVEVVDVGGLRRLIH